MYTFAIPTGPITYQQPYAHNHNHFTPQTPSPLRTSRNANLLPVSMPPPSPSDCWSSPLDTKSSPVGHTQQYTYTSNHHQPNFQTPQPQPPRRSTITFSSPPPSSNSHAKFAYASRSLSSNPQSTLSTYTASARDRRKTLFRDRIRRQRDDARFGGRGEQVLRMDFVRERREWMQRLELEEAPPAEMDGEGNLEMGEEQEEGGEMVPLTEEEEIEALVEFLVDREDEKRDQGEGSRVDSGAGGAGTMTGSYGSDEEDYDQLFMDVISASQEPEDGGAGKAESAQQPWQGQGQIQSLCDREDMTSSCMDLS